MPAMRARRTAVSGARLLALVGAAAGEGQASLRGAASGAAADGGAARRLGAPNGKWGPYMDGWSSLPVYASEICVRCVGGYAMQYNIWDTHTNWTSEWSNTIGAQETACMPVDSIRDVVEDHPISPRIFVKGSADSFVQVAIQSVRYRAGAGQAHYTCLGSTTSWYCILDTVGDLGSLGPTSTSAAPSSTGSISGAGSLEAAGVEREPNGTWGPYMNSWSVDKTSQLTQNAAGGVDCPRENTRPCTTHDLFGSDFSTCCTGIDDGWIVPGYRCPRNVPNQCTRGYCCEEGYVGKFCTAC